ncbi:MAG: D-alanyl-D-alanine carboxypeptidase family protein [Candidatus Puniceispirillales bacterium]
MKNYKLLFFSFLVLLTFSKYSLSMDTVAKQAIMIEPDTGQIILEKNSDELMKPASMAKLMTIYIAFEKIKNKSISLDDKFIVSEKAWKKRGSRTFLEPGQTVSVEDLLRGVIVQSGNDAAIVLAEGISGTEDIFSDLMNSVARELKMKNTIFKNSTGWPDPLQNTSSRDLSILALNLINKFPDLYKMFAEISFTYNGIKQGNRNPILYNNLVFGADGLKTGHTQESGYGLVASAKRDNLRFILVLNGMTSMRQRKQESSRLLNSAFREFKKLKIYNLNETVTKAKVFLGESDNISLIVKDEISLLLNSVEQREMRVKASWKEPISAPVNKNTILGALTIEIPNKTALSYPLYAGSDIPKQGFIKRIGSTIDYIIWGSVK